MPAIAHLKVAKLPPKNQTREHVEFLIRWFEIHFYSSLSDYKKLGTTNLNNNQNAFFKQLSKNYFWSLLV